MSYVVVRGLGEGVEGDPASFECTSRGGTWMGTYCLGGSAPSQPTGLKATACKNKGGAWNAAVNFCVCPPPSLWNGIDCVSNAPAAGAAGTAAAGAAAAAAAAAAIVQALTQACAQRGGTYSKALQQCVMPQPKPQALPPAPLPAEPEVVMEEPFYRKPIGMAVIAGVAILAVALVASRKKKMTANKRRRRARANGLARLGAAKKRSGGAVMGERRVPRAVLVRKAERAYAKRTADRRRKATARIKSKFDASRKAWLAEFDNLSWGKAAPNRRRRARRSRR